MIPELPNIRCLYNLCHICVLLKEMHRHFHSYLVNLILYPKKVCFMNASRVLYNANDEDF